MGLRILREPGHLATWALTTSRLAIRYCGIILVTQVYSASQQHGRAVEDSLHHTTGDYYLVGEYLDYQYFPLSSALKEGLRRRDSRTRDLDAYVQPESEKVRTPVARSEVYAYES
jgi:hypothetical protein